MAKWIKIKGLYGNEDYIVSVTSGASGKVMVKLSNDADPASVGISPLGYPVSEVPELLEYIRRQAGEPLDDIPMA